MISIYKITNTITKEFYIGSTKDPKRRKSQHFRNFKNSRANKIIQESVYKYGVDNFIFEIIEDDILEEKRTEKEQFYIDLLNPEFNIIEDVLNPIPNKNIIYQIDIDGNILNVFNNAVEASRILNISDSAIRTCALGKTSNSGGFIFIKESELDSINERIKYFKSVINKEYINDEFKSKARLNRLGKKHKNLEKIRKVNYELNRKGIIQYDLDMNYIREFDSIKSCLSENGGFKYPGMCDCLSGRNKTYKGFIFRYKTT